MLTDRRECAEHKEEAIDEDESVGVFPVIIFVVIYESVLQHLHHFSRVVLVDGKSEVRFRVKRITLYPR